MYQEPTVLSVAQVHREVVVSKRNLEDTLGQRVRAFCYPYGAWNGRIASVVREAGQGGGDLGAACL